MVNASRNLANAAAALVLWTLFPIGGAAALEPGTPLSEWLTTEVEPMLAERFSTHPRLRGTAVQVLPMRDAQREIPASGLAVTIADRLTQTLTAQAGTRIVPPAPLTSVQACMEQDAVEYRLGVDVRAATTGAARATVTVRLLDAHEGSWVGGVSARWSGVLSGAERRALAREVLDEGTRGSRALPFEVSQPDLVARSLLGQLECALARQRVAAAGVEAGLHLQAPPDMDRQLRQAGGLLMHELAVRRGWAERASSERASLQLRLRAQPLGEDALSLLLVTLERLSANETAGQRRVLASAQSYVRGAADGGGATSVRRAPAPREAPVAATPVPAPVEGAEAGGERAAQRPRAASSLLPSAPVLRTAVGKACADGSNRAPGGLRGRRGGAAPACESVEVEVGEAATVFWLWQPAQCALPAADGPGATRLTESRALRPGRLRTPVPPFASADGAGGAQTPPLLSVYAIAVAASADPAAVREVLRQHPGGRDCASPRWSQRLQRWALALESTLLRLDERAAWEGLRLSPLRLAAGDEDVAGGDQR